MTQFDEHIFKWAETKLVHVCFSLFLTFIHLSKLTRCLHIEMHTSQLKFRTRFTICLSGNPKTSSERSQPLRSPKINLDFQAQLCRGHQGPHYEELSVVPYDNGNIESLEVSPPLCWRESVIKTGESCQSSAQIF